MRNYVCAAAVCLLSSCELRADLQEAARLAIPATVEIGVSEPQVETDNDSDESLNAAVVTPLADGTALKEHVLLLEEGGPGTIQVTPVTPKQKDGSGSGFKSARPGTTFLSGTIVSADGLIVTHGASAVNKDISLNVRLQDGRQLPAKFLVNDERSGLALLKVEANGELPYLEVAGTEPAVGQNVAGVANIHGYRHSFSRGIVSSLNRTVQATIPMPPMIQTDVEAGAGSSGGPLVNTRGKLVGILAVIATRNGGGGAITFAVPARHVKQLLDAQNGTSLVTIRSGYLGIELADAEGLPFIKKVYENTPAAKVNIQTGDQIRTVNQISVFSSADVVSQIGAFAEGDRVQLGLRRNNLNLVENVTLGIRPTSQSPDDQIPRASWTTPSIMFGVKDFQGRLVPIQIEQRFRNAAPPPGVAGLLPPTAPVPVTPSIRVERSNVEEKIDQLGKDIQELQKQISRLTDSFQKDSRPQETTR